MTSSAQPDGSRLDRNWAELLQEVRVAQTGAQLLSGFLITLPFTQRFELLDDAERVVFLTVLMATVAATGLLVAPAAMHRVLFRQGERLWLVETASRLAYAGLVVMGAASCGAVWLVFDVVAGRTPAWLAAGATALFMTALWGVLPGLVRTGRGHVPPAEPTPAGGRAPGGRASARGRHR